MSFNLWLERTTKWVLHLCYEPAHCTEGGFYSHVALEGLTVQSPLCRSLVNWWEQGE